MLLTTYHLNTGVEPARLQPRIDLSSFRFRWLRNHLGPTFSARSLAVQLKTVALKGFEPSRLSALVPKTSVSAIPPQGHKQCAYGESNSDSNVGNVMCDHNTLGAFPTNLIPRRLGGGPRATEQRKQGESNSPSPIKGNRISSAARLPTAMILP